MPTLTIPTTSVASGQSLNFSFSGFPANTPVEVWPALSPTEGLAMPVTVTSDASGSGTGSIPAVVSEVALNAILYALDVNNTSIWTSVAYSITTAPLLGLLPSTIKLGDPFDAYLYNFSPNATVTVKVGTAAAGYKTFFTLNTDSSGNGSITVTTAQVIAEAGTYTLIATDTQGKTAQTTLVVAGLAASTTPVLKIENPSIPSNGTMVFNYSGFNPNAAVTVTSTGIISGGAAAGTAGADGTGSSAVVVIGIVGNYTLTATDAEGKKATASFTVTSGGPSITVTPNVTKDTFTYKVAGFPANDKLTIAVFMTGQSPVYTGTVTTDSSGAATGTFSVAGFASGAYNITANDTSGYAAVNNFAITMVAAGSPSGWVQIVLTQALPATVSVGTEYAIEGTVKLFAKFGAPPWVYAKLQHHQILEPSAIDSVEFARGGFPNPSTGEFTIHWTPKTAGTYTYTVIFTPAPIAVGTVAAFADILVEPILAQTAPALETKAN